jgi:hypothetical protein
MISPLRDPQGLRQAAKELFAEMLKGEQLTRLQQKLARAENADRLKLKDRGISFTMADGYYVAVEYLMKLQQLREHDGELPLRSDEISALAAVRAAHEEFRREHPPCPKCGALNDAFAPACSRCNEQLLKPAAQGPRLTRING